MPAIVLFALFFILVAARIPIAMTMGISTAISFVAGNYTNSFFVIPKKTCRSLKHKLNYKV